ncbi:hypothetical protein ACRALDRAFT_1080807 [Sodiomyces alcalophilus JCM 7366]|uniref:uncharacterized protein n=1 Tax=Sodiomyces alcalophilus JCM 7366 TaxID=591952 RepID=UPI0039B45FC8
MSANASSQPRILELASTISDSVAKLHQILTAAGQPSPSFDEDAPLAIPKEGSDAQDAILDATSELYDLLLEPLDLLFQKSGHVNNVSMQAISRHNIASIVPAGGQISFAEIAKQTGLDESALTRILRHAMTMRIFREPEPGMVAHTKVSKMLALPHVNDWQYTGSHEMWPAAAKTIDAMHKWPSSEEPNETGYSLANNTTESIYGVLSADPSRALRFAGAMKAYSLGSGHHTSYIVDHYPWGSLPRTTATETTRVVDMGGGRGHVAMALAKRFDNLTFLIQDIPQIVEGAAADVPDELKGRIEFLPHDIFAPQTAEADVYYLRWILHNWSDKYCRAILTSLIPALRKGARVVVQDTCMPEPGAIALWREKDLRAADLNMAAVFNARERMVSEWRELFSSTDARFVLNQVIEPKGSALGILEFLWEGS